MTTEKSKTKKETKPVKEVTPEKKEVAKPMETVVMEATHAPLDLDQADGMSEDFPTEKDVASKPDRYFEATGRRKTAVARVRLFTRGEKQFLINGKDYQQYFPLKEDQENSVASMKKMKCLDKFRVTVIVRGGGRHAQSEAVRHGTARVLVDFNNNFRKRLRKAGYLTRDPRMRERKKFGLKRARKSPQWAKR